MSGCYHHHHFVLVIIIVTISRVPLVCQYNDTLAVDLEDNPKYVNGEVKFVMFNKPITLHELVEKIHRITKINSNEYQIHLACNWPLAQVCFIAVSITDDDNTRAILELNPFVNSIETYVEKKDVTH